MMEYLIAIRKYHERQIKIIAQSEVHRLMELSWQPSAEEYIRSYNAEAEVKSRFEAWHREHCPCLDRHRS